jgi:hypothetical protein
VFENKVLRGIFESKREGVSGTWRRLHNEGFHNLYASPNIIRVIKSRRVKWLGHTAHIRKMLNAYKSLVGEPEGKRPLGRHRRRWEDNIRKHL